MRRGILAAGGLALALITASADASVIWSFEEIGGEVVGTVSGSLDLTGAEKAPAIWSFPSPAIYALRGTAAFGSDLQAYTAITQLSFGAGPNTSGTSSSGPGFGVINFLPGRWILLPGGYAGESLAGSMTFAGATFASLGVTLGEHVYSLPNDTVTLRFGSPAAIPLPASLPLFLAALGMTFAFGRRRA